MPALYLQAYQQRSWLDRLQFRYLLNLENFGKKMKLMLHLVTPDPVDVDEQIGHISPIHAPSDRTEERVHGEMPQCVRALLAPWFCPLKNRKTIGIADLWDSFHGYSW